MAKILIVDDEPNIREVVGLYLRQEGHGVVSAR
jgi:DNA-binding response OmpR family regulator